MIWVGRGTMNYCGKCGGGCGASMGMHVVKTNFSGCRRFILLRCRFFRRRTGRVRPCGQKSRSGSDWIVRGAMEQRLL